MILCISYLPEIIHISLEEIQSVVDYRSNEILLLRPFHRITC